MAVMIVVLLFVGVLLWLAWRASYQRPRLAAAILVVAILLVLVLAVVPSIRWRLEDLRLQPAPFSAEAEISAATAQSSPGGGGSFLKGSQFCPILIS